MIADPVATPDTIPLEEPIEAFARLLLLQIPPEDASFKEDTDPTQILAFPVIDEGRATTFIVVVFIQPVASV
jgi:hypothetical protein